MSREEPPHHRLIAPESGVKTTLLAAARWMTAMLFSFIVIFILILVYALLVDIRTSSGTPVTTDYSQLAQPTPSADYSASLVSVITDKVQPDRQDAALDALSAAIQSVRHKTSDVGRLVFTRPSIMRVDKSYYITLRVAKGSHVNLTEELEFLEGNLEKRRVKVAGIMEAKLSGSEKVFDIAPLSRQEQALEDNEYTEWKWQITPLTSGIHRLRLTVAKKVDTSEGPAFKEERVLDEEFKVTISTVERATKFVFQHFEFLAGAIFLPGLLVTGKRIAKVSQKRARAWLGVNRPQADASVEKEHPDKAKDQSPSKTVESR